MRKLIDYAPLCREFMIRRQPARRGTAKLLQYYTRKKTENAETKRQYILPILINSYSSCPSEISINNI